MLVVDLDPVLILVVEAAVPAAPVMILNLDLDIMMVALV